MACERNRDRIGRGGSLRRSVLGVGYWGEPAKTIFAAVPEYQPLIGGAWLLAGVLGGYLIRKPGAALYCEVVAAIISVLLTGGAFSGEILLAGLIQGVGAEIAFAVFAYRRWNLPVAVFAGALAGRYRLVGAH